LSDEEKVGKAIRVVVSKADQMNVYLYGGNSRENATQQITDYNDPV
jgi:hypothetical protein